jgi:hypothetical protein
MYALNSVETENSDGNVLSDDCFAIRSILGDVVSKGGRRSIVPNDATLLKSRNVGSTIARKGGDGQAKDGYLVPLREADAGRGGIEASLESSLERLKRDF